MSQFSSPSPAAAALDRENVWQREAVWSATTGAAISEANTKRFYAWSQDGFFKNLRARARYAKVWQKGDEWRAAAGAIQYVDYSINDVRFDVQLNVPFNFFR